MATLTIKGDRKYLDVIAKENRTRASRYNLSLEIKEDGLVKKAVKVEAKKPTKQPVKKGSKAQKDK